MISKIVRMLPRWILPCLVVSCCLAEGSDRSKRQTAERPPVFQHPTCSFSLTNCSEVDYIAHVNTGDLQTSQDLSVLPSSIRAKDPDSTDFPIIFSFVNGTPPNYSDFFAIDYQTGDIRQQRGIPTGLTDRFTIVIRARKRGGNLPFSLARLTVFVAAQGESDGSPALQVSSYQGYIEENAKIGTTVRINPNPQSDPLQVIVVDENLPDGTTHHSAYQYILSGTGAQIFALNQAGYIYLNSPVFADSKLQNSYVLTVQAREIDTPTLRVSPLVNISIEMLKIAGEPRFNSSVNSVRVESGANGYREIYQIRAYDTAGVESEFAYGIVSVSAGGASLFRYDSVKGAIMATSALMPGSQYQIVLEATNAAGKKAQAIITVDVDPEPILIRTTVTPAPLITSQSIINPIPVNRSTPPGTIISQLRATASTGEPLKYTIIGGNEGGKFRLDPKSGEISTAQPLDRDLTPQYPLIIEASNGGALKNQTILTMVIREDLKSPKILNAPPVLFTVSEAVANAFVGQIEAQDESDTQGPIYFSIKSTTAYFVIDPDSGSIYTLKGIITREMGNSFFVTVVASRGGSEIFSTSIDANINVVKQSVAPYFNQTNYEVSVNENSGAMQIAAVKAISDGSEVTYVLRQGDSQLFTIDSQTGVISTLSDLDAETQQNYKLTVGIEQNPSAEATVTVSVKDTNDWKPTFSQTSYSASIIDSAPIGTPLMQLMATDKDLEAQNNLIRYSVISNSYASTFFAINPDSGLITIVKNLQEYPDANATIFIEAKDLGQPPLDSNTSVTVLITKTQPITTASVPTTTATTAVERTTQQHTTIPTVFTTTTQLIPVRFFNKQYSVSIPVDTHTPSVIYTFPILNKPLSFNDYQCRIDTGNLVGIFSTSLNEEGDCQLMLMSNSTNFNQFSLTISVSNTNQFGQGDFTFANVTFVGPQRVSNLHFVYPYAHLNLNVHYGLVPIEAELKSTLFQASPMPGKNRLFIQAFDPENTKSTNISYSMPKNTADSRYFGLNSYTGEVSYEERLADPNRTYSFPVESQNFQAGVISNPATTEVVVNSIAPINRFILLIDTLTPETAVAYITDIVNALQQLTGPCQVIGYENLKPVGTGSELWMFAINPNTKQICSRANELRQLMSDGSLVQLRQQLADKLLIREIKVPPVISQLSGVRSIGDWNGAQIAIVVLACVLVIGCVISILCLCLFWSRYKEAQTTMVAKPSFYSIMPHYNPLLIANSDKEYETQILEMSMAEDSHSVKGAIDAPFTVDEGNYNRPKLANKHEYRGPLSQGVVIPPPDYPTSTSNFSPEGAYQPASSHYSKPVEKMTIL